MIFFMAHAKDIIFILWIIVILLILWIIDLSIN